MDEPRDRELAAARAAPDRVLGLEHRDLDALARERDRAGQPVRAGADDDRGAHATGGGLGPALAPSGDLDREVEGLLEPGPALDHLGHVDPALLDQPVAASWMR